MLGGLILSMLLLASPSDSLKINVELEGSLGSNAAVRPLWSYSQEWGRYTQYDKASAGAHASLSYGFTNNSWFHVGAGASFQSATGRNNSRVSELYINAKLLIFDITAGRQAYTPLNQRGGLGLGTYLMSDNALPVTRAGVGIFDWWAVPGISNWLEIKGGLFLGKMPDEDNASYVKGALLHEKFAYFRIGHFPVKPYLGLTHSVLMGGTRANGEVIPVDFWASFFAKSSSKLSASGFEGEFTNAAGGHQGLWDLGLDFDFPAVSGSVYYQRPFSDSNAMNLWKFAKCRDITLGADVKIKNFRYLDRVCFEYFTTVWQGGNGPADAWFYSTGTKKNGSLICLPPAMLNTGNVREYFSESIISGWEAGHGTLTNEKMNDFLLDVVNTKDGVRWDWGNRTTYLCNYLYPQGWTVNGLSMGSSIFLSKNTMERVAPGYTYSDTFSCIRLRAFNIGITGEIIQKLRYKFKFTWSDNYGNYQDQYYGGVNFHKLRPNYYFTTDKIECYTGLWLDYNFGKAAVTSCFAYDFGDIYNSFCVRIGAKYTFGRRLFTKTAK